MALKSRSMATVQSVSNPTKPSPGYTALEAQDDDPNPTNAIPVKILPVIREQMFRSITKLEPVSRADSGFESTAQIELVDMMSENDDSSR